MVAPARPSGPRQSVGASSRAIRRSNDGGEFLLWDVHQDTVPVDGMTVDPFGGELRDGRVYGRGACDVKGSMAAMLAAISRLRLQTSRQRHNSPTIVIAFTVNEECGFTGCRRYCDLLAPRSEMPNADDCRRHDFARGNVSPSARRSHRCRADGIQRGRRPSRRRALALPHDRPGGSHVAA